MIREHPMFQLALARICGAVIGLARMIAGFRRTTSSSVTVADGAGLSAYTLRAASPSPT